MGKYRLYWNLHKKKWSLQDRKTGRVRQHVTAFTMYDAKFVVRKAGQAKVRSEGRKNVHAFAVGTGACVMALLPACQVDLSHTTLM